MLTFSLRPRCEGIAIYGDYLSLKETHDVVHDINERSPLIEDKEGVFLALAYDLRKAYDGQRLRQDHDKKDLLNMPEIGIRFSCEFLWPTILIQSKQLRSALAFMNHDKRHQAVAYELEAVVEGAITEQFKDSGNLIKTLWERLVIGHPYLEKNIDTRLAQFEAWTAAERRRGLAGLLKSLDPMYPGLY